VEIREIVSWPLEIIKNAYGEAGTISQSVGRHMYLYLFYNSHVRWVPCHHGMARAQVADGEGGLQLCSVAGNILSRI
jgi:hypothetical protein